MDIKVTHIHDNGFGFGASTETGEIVHIPNAIVSACSLGVGAHLDVETAEPLPGYEYPSVRRITRRLEVAPEQLPLDLDEPAFDDDAFERELRAMCEEAKRIADASEALEKRALDTLNRWLSDE